MLNRQVLGQLALSAAIGFTGVANAQRGASPSIGVPAIGGVIPMAAGGGAVYVVDHSNPSANPAALPTAHLTESAAPAASAAAASAPAASAASGIDGATVTSNPPSVRVQVQYVAPSVSKLGQRISISENLPDIKVCFKELGITAKPLNETLAQDAQKVVDCVDQKAINAFINNPAVKREEVSNLIWNTSLNPDDLKVATTIRTDINFAQIIAANCKAKGQTIGNTFVTCATNVGRAEVESATQASRENAAALVLTGALLGFGAIAIGGGLLRTRREAKGNMSAGPDVQPG